MNTTVETSLSGKIAVISVMFIISLLGTIVNVTVTFVTHTLKTMKNPFGRLAACQACGEAIICAVFTFYVTPMLIFDVEWMKANHRIVGWLNFMCYDVCIWSHLFISINRMIAICFPFRYDRIFSKRVTIIIAICVWVIAFCTAVFMYNLFTSNGCDFLFSEKFWAFIFSTNEVCLFISWTLDFCKDIIILIIIATTDFITLVRLITTKLIGATSNTMRVRRKMETNFFRQVVLQSSIFLIELCTYFVVAWKFDNRYAVWFFTTVCWLLIHTMDGMITIAFNKEYTAMQNYRIILSISVICNKLWHSGTSHNSSQVTPPSIVGTGRNAVAPSDISLRQITPERTGSRA